MAWPGPGSAVEHKILIFVTRTGIWGLTPRRPGLDVAWPGLCSRPGLDVAWPDPCSALRLKISIFVTKTGILWVNAEQARPGRGLAWPLLGVKA